MTRYERAEVSAWCKTRIVFSGLSLLTGQRFMLCLRPRVVPRSGMLRWWNNSLSLDRLRGFGMWVMVAARRAVANTQCASFTAS